MYIAGIDEVGRGPLAGPVSIGVVWVKKDVVVEDLIPGITDSKKLSEKKREAIYRAVGSFSEISYTVCSRDASYIDEGGIKGALKDAISEACSMLPAETFVYLDGRLSAPSSFLQKTVVGGDLNVPVISLASIMAKVERDRYMKKMSEDYPQYGFHKHKGYGTKAHREAIVEYGFSPLHRVSFCGRLTG